MREDHIPSTPMGHDGSAEQGTNDGPITKPMDKPPKQYLANETVPEHDFHAEAPPTEVENPGDLSKRFVR